MLPPTTVSPAAPRAVVPSLFSADSDTVYFAGFDAHKAPAHHTAWIARAPVSAVLWPAD